MNEFVGYVPIHYKKLNTNSVVPSKQINVQSLSLQVFVPLGDCHPPWFCRLQICECWGVWDSEFIQSTDHCWGCADYGLCEQQNSFECFCSLPINL